MSAMIYPYSYIAVGGRFCLLFLYFKEKYVLWEKPYTCIPHVIIEYDLYPLSLVISQV